MSREVKIIECGRCRREVHVRVVVGTLDSSRLKCASCKIIEDKESVENLMSAIFKARTKSGQKQADVHL